MFPVNSGMELRRAIGGYPNNMLSSLDVLRLLRNAISGPGGQGYLMERAVATV